MDSPWESTRKVIGFPKMQLAVTAIGCKVKRFGETFGAVLK